MLEYKNASQYHSAHNRIKGTLWQGTLLLNQPPILGQLENLLSQVMLLSS